jgi:hypothetical protein
MASTNGKYFEDRDSDRYGVLGPDCPLPENQPGDEAANGRGESGADSPETAHRGRGDGELSGDFTTGRPSPPPVLADQHVPEEVQDLLRDTGEWDALDAIYEQLHQVQATLYRVRRALQALTNAKIAALPGASAARLLRGGRKHSNRDDLPPMLKSPAEETADPEPVPVSRAAKKPKEADVDFHPVVHRQPGETPPSRPRRATTIEPLRAGAAGSRLYEENIPPQNGKESNGKPQTKQSGRSSRVLIEEVRSTVVHYLEAGLSIRQAAAFVGCHHTTIVKAVQRDRGFAERIERAQEIGRAMPLVRIIRASRRCWRAAAWLVRHQRAADAA